MAQTKGVSVSNTGMDMDALVKASVSTYQSKYDSAYKKETVAEWTKSAYADLYTELTKFKATASDYKLQSKTTAHTATSTDATVVTATANGDALNLTHDVTVGTIARNASLQSTTAITRAITTDADGKDTSKSTKLSDIAGVTLTKDNKESTNVAISFYVQDSATSTEKHAISYTYKDLQTKTLTDLAADIKNLTTTTATADKKTVSTNIMATYDATNDTMNIYNKQAGAANIIQIKADDTDATAKGFTNTLLKNLNLGTYDGKDLTSITTDDLSGTNIKGISSSITVDGKTYTGTSNAITVAGVTYTANKVSSGSTRIAIGTDSDTLVKSVQSFVDSYNTLLDKMNDQLHATKSSTYGALTADQKSAMTADEITAWETKAKTGLLRNDSLLSQAVDDMRTSMTLPVTGTGVYKTAGSIGLTVGDWKTYGHITLDTDKLKTAIADDPSVVDAILAGDNQNTSTKDLGSQGVATRLSNLLTVDMKNFSNEAGTSASTSDTSTLGTKITDMNTNLTALLKVLQDKQDYYYTKYNDMESAVGKLTSSLSSVTSFLG